MISLRQATDSGHWPHAEEPGNRQFPEASQPGDSPEPVCQPLPLLPGSLCLPCCGGGVGWVAEGRVLCLLSYSLWPCFSTLAHLGGSGRYWYLGPAPIQLNNIVSWVPGPHLPLSPKGRP